MKTIIALMAYTTALLPFSSFAQSVGNSELINEKIKARYPLKQATVTYAITGDAQGSVILYFDRNGWRSATEKELTIKRYGIESVEKRKTITDGDYVYEINLETNTGTKTKDNKWSSLLGYKDATAAIAAIHASNGGELTGQDTVLNRLCNKWEFEKGAVKSLWEWQGLTLKKVKEMPGLNYTETATSISSEAPLDPTIFELTQDLSLE